MERYRLDKPAIIWRGTTYVCDSIEYLVKGVVQETLTDHSATFSRRVGSHPSEIVVKGRFAPTDLADFRDMIRGFNQTENVFVINGEVIPKPVLLEGRAGLKSDSSLGEFYLRFGVIPTNV